MLSAQGRAGHSTGLPAPAAWRGAGAAAHGVARVAHGPAVSGSRRRGAEDALLLFKGAMQKPNLRSAHVPLGARQASPGARSPQKGRETAVSRARREVGCCAEWSWRGHRPRPRESALPAPQPVRFSRFCFSVSRLVTGLQSRLKTAC